MKLFVVLSCIALAAAKPQGYSYNQPSAGGVGLSSLGSAPAASFGGATPSFSSGASFGSGSSLSSGSFSGSSSLSAGSAPSFGSFGGAQQSAQSFAQSASFGGAQQSTQSFAPSASFGSFGGAQQSAQSFAPSASFGGAQQSFAPVAQPQANQVTVQKHIYVHVPPHDDEEVQQDIPAPVQAQKHYKIIFIKAPSAPAINPQHFQQPQNEEKTIVYVLAKKQESFAELAKQVQPAPVTPSKPEVYFIKYKTEKEQQQLAAAPLALSAQSGASIQASSDSVSIESGHQGLGSAEASFPISAAAPVAPAPVAPISAPFPSAGQHQPAQVYGPAN